MRNQLIEDFAKKEYQKIANSLEITSQIQETLVDQAEISWTSLPINHNELGVLLHTTHANYLPSYSLHSHDFFELIYVYKGNAVQHIENDSIYLTEGSVCLMNTNYKHGLSVDSPDSIIFNIAISKPILNTSFLNLISANDLFSTFFINSLFSGTEKGEFMHFERNKDSRMDVLMQLLLEEYILKKPDYSAAMQSYLTLIFTELHRKHIYTSVQSEHYDIDFPKIMSYVSNHLDNVNINSLADHFHYSPAYLSKALKRYLGKSFSSVLSDLKLAKAASYLENTTISIDFIVELLGYYDRSYFNKVFKKRFGMGPKEYRETKSTTTD